MIALVICALLLAASAGLQAQSEAYKRGTRALDRHEWKEAAEAFAEVAGEQGTRSDAALYWRAYALGKLNRVEAALESLEKLQRRFPDSRWADDADQLRAELTGEASIRDEKEELRLMALFSLIGSDPDRAVQYLEKFLSGDNSHDGKEQALFLTMQTGSSEALELVASIAKGDQGPELQVAAVQALGLAGEPRSEELLAEIYRTTEATDVKHAILQAYVMAGDSERLLEIARQENGEALRHEAIRLLGMTGAQTELWELFQAETSTDTQRAIIEGMAVGGCEKYLMEIAASDAEPAMRAAAIEGLGISGFPSVDLLAGMYEQERDQEVRQAVIQALFTQGEVGALITIARNEDDPELKRDIVRLLAAMGSEEAIEFMMELLDE
jgi:tetratricopeptide (TPR) repeat protein